jgi:hypothetical protein
LFVPVGCGLAFLGVRGRAADLRHLSAREFAGELAGELVVAAIAAVIFVILSILF